MTTDGKGKGKGKSGSPRPPPSVADKEELKRQAAARKAEADAEFKKLREAEAQQIAFAERLHTCKTRSIQGVPWDTAQITYHLGAGTKHTGVIAVLLDNDEVVCVRDHNSSTELVAQAVANAIGIRVAQFRMVHEGDPEYEIMNEALVQADAKGAEKEKVTCSRAILEFVPGLTWDVALRTGTHTEEMFAAVGRVCVIDLLLNNMDRVPLTFWDAELGNLTNIMVGEDGSIIGIDQQVNMIGSEEGMEQYLGRLRRFVTHIMRRDYAHFVIKQALAKVEKAIQIVSEVEVSPECMLALAKGFREGLVSFEQCWSSGELETGLARAAEAAVRVKGQLPPIPEMGQYAAACVRKVADVVAPLVRDEGERLAAA